MKVIKRKKGESGIYIINYIFIIQVKYCGE